MFMCTPDYQDIEYNYSKKQSNEQVQVNGNVTHTCHIAQNLQVLVGKTTSVVQSQRKITAPYHKTANIIRYHIKGSQWYPQDLWLQLIGQTAGRNCRCQREYGWFSTESFRSAELSRYGYRDYESYITVSPAVHALFLPIFSRSQENHTAGSCESRRLPAFPPVPSRPRYHRCASGLRGTLLEK